MSYIKEKKEAKNNFFLKLSFRNSFYVLLDTYKYLLYKIFGFHDVCTNDSLEQIMKLNCDSIRENENWKLR